jgi:membrane protein implicated in regulation of membrane protease activity
MDASKLLQWYNLIFWLPMAVAALLLLLTSLRLGHHGGHHGGHGAHAGHAPTHAPPVGHAHAPVTHGHAPVAPGHSHGPAAGHPPAPGSHPSAPAHGTNHPAPHPAQNRHDGSSKSSDQRPNVTVTTNVAAHFHGPRRAPLMMVLEAFLLLWGIFGLWASQRMLHGDNPTPGQVLPVLGIALAGGVVGGRIAAWFIARILPPDETLIVSHDGLFGMTGVVAFPVSREAGRIHIYDQYGTLHDEMCRTAPDHAPIEKGRRAMVMDVDTQGNLIVEEVADSVR